MASIGGGPTRKKYDPNSQATIDAFAIWKQKQAELVTQRGENARDPAAEELHNKTMMRHCLNAYICHMELDAYAGCLKKNGLWGEKSEQYELPTKAPLHQVKCATQHDRYAKCLGKEDNQHTLTATAILNPQCRTFHKTFTACVDVNSSKSLEETEVECTPSYRRLLRCGLNHLWEEYYRSLNQIGDQEDFQSFEIASDPKKREMFTSLMMNAQNKAANDPQVAAIYNRTNPESEFKD